MKEIIKKDMWVPCCAVRLDINLLYFVCFVVFCRNNEEIECQWIYKLHIQITNTHIQTNNYTCIIL